MHTGLTHFTGRDIPTIWSCFSPNEESSVRLTSPFTGVDSAVIRDWARQLDDWLTLFANERHISEHDRKLILRQYVLQRLLVLSIYLPARGLSLFSQNTTPEGQYELLVSARTALKLHVDDRSIWSNWDLIMITWAALIVLQGFEANVGEPDGWTSPTQSSAVLPKLTSDQILQISERISRCFIPPTNPNRASDGNLPVD